MPSCLLILMFIGSHEGIVNKLKILEKWRYPNAC
jgi:hypothetical protein